MKYGSADATRGHDPELHAAMSMATPQEDFARIASKCPVIHNPNGSLTVTRMVDVAELHKNREVMAQGLLSPGVGASRRRLIPLDLEGPEHTKYRRLLDPAFAPKRMVLLEPAVTKLSDEVIDSFIGKGSVDIFNKWCRIVPGAMFLELFGLPRTDLDWLLEFNNTQLHADAAMSPEEAMAARQKSADEFYDYLDQAISARRQSSGRGSDLLSTLLEVEIDGERLTQEDILDVGYLAIIAGLDTVASALADIIVRLAVRTDLRERLVAQPDLWRSATEEFLRYESPVTHSRRGSLSPVNIAGEEVPPRTIMFMFWPTCNLDEETFTDPLRIDLERSPNPHIAFGMGKHRCLGSHLARMEIRVAMRSLLARIPDYRLAQDPDYNTGGNPRSPAALTICW